MSVSNTTVKQIYEGDGSLVVFAIPFPYFQETEVDVYLRDNSVTPVTETLLTQNTHYTLTDVVDGLPTNVTMNTAPADNSTGLGEQLVVYRLVPLTQEVAPSEAAVEEQLDRSAMMSQQISEELSRMMKVSLSSGLSSIELEPAAGLFLKWNATGTAIITEAIDLSTIETNVSNNASNIAINTAGILANGVAISANETDILTNASNIALVSGNLGNLVSRVDSIDTDQTTQDTLIGELQASLSELQAYMGIVGSQEILNSEVAPTNITAFTFDGDSTTSVLIEYEIRRRTDSDNLHSVGTLTLMYRDTSVWETERGLTTFDIDGVTFTIVTSGGNIGTIQYISNNLAGVSYDGIIKYRIRKFEV